MLAGDIQIRRDQKAQIAGTLVGPFVPPVFNTTVMILYLIFVSLKNVLDEKALWSYNYTGSIKRLYGDAMERPTTLKERFGLCPYATAQSLISGKWAVLILFYLEDGSIRFNELLRKMPKMTHATLSVQLKSLEEYGLVKREQFEEIPPKVAYSLTEIGKKFHPVIEAMETFGNEYIAQMNGGEKQ